MKYTPHTAEDIKKMLDTIGAVSVEDLFSDIPAGLRTKSFDLPEGAGESQTMDYFRKLADTYSDGLISFTGGGFYDHYIPSAVNALSSLPEFYTAYTPYQPEASQGTLQSLYEYQSAICRLTGMEASNASVYDGGTAIAEAVLMALKITRRRKIIIDSCVNPIYRHILQTYTEYLDCQIIEIEDAGLSMDREKCKLLLDSDTAAVVFQNPNFFGTLDDYSDITAMAHDNGSLAIASVYPVSLGSLKTPREMNADIAAGEAQSLGNPLNFGGPYLGFMATREKYIRHLPGRIAGETTDSDGRRAFVLTLQAREQHIKRHRATSNICTNQNMCALRALIFLSCLGKTGFRELALLNHDKAHYASGLLSEIPGVYVCNPKGFFNEFTLELGTDSAKLYKSMLKKGFSAGLPLGNFYNNMHTKLLVCFTEKTDKDRIHSFVDTFMETLSGTS
ncbi:MAG: aminomethyl-transferring glycine dehydrogenase subunit GcvPA [Elusimicrobiota bacterium]